ncbi:MULTISPECIES: S9 family peptidase [Asticcacaulis]|uniref:alpha/beta hydrolase family protein n=1 Tax=Asticcacaulis TaxID=76890 RepID=UPI001AE23B8B|nr:MULTISPECIES: prolyl oligopeptidase family serine peptidase [Asticcacaulis]MBP2157474.1 putative esterase [Asticcacaulis solisilvae]MDR6798519.1 putative esterase [Asticcacaulis sp. BE141]
MQKLQRTILVAWAALALAGTVRGQTRTEADADPLAVMRVGDHLVLFAKDQSLWRRGPEDGAIWQAISLPESLKTTNVTCASDASGMCIIRTGTPGTERTALLDIGAGAVTEIDTGTAAIMAMPDRETAYLRRVEGDVAQLVHRSLKSGVETPVGQIGMDEQVIFFPIAGKLAPAAFTVRGNMRLVADNTPVSFQLAENLILLSDGVLLREAWSAEPPVTAGRRAVGHVRFKTIARDGKRFVDHEIATVGAWPVSGPLFDQRNGGADANDDVAVELLGGGVNQIAILCRSGGGYGFKAIADIPRDQRTSIIASQAGRGFVLRTTGLNHTPEFATLDLSPSAGGWRDRDCGATKYRISPAGIAVAKRNDVETLRGEAVSGDGTKVPWVAVLPAGGKPDHVIMDVYGAYGAKHAFEAYQDMTINQMKALNTAIVFAIVRGDGDLGYDYALASRSPNRDRAVDDTIAVAAAIVKQFPRLKTKPTVRGQSAGGWLAVRSALARPDLFSGAIGYSGVYLLEGDPLANNGYRYFSDDEDLAPVLERTKSLACPALRFRIIHARDDFLASYDKAESFADMLTAAGCPTDMVTFEDGGHAIEVLPHQPEKAMRRLEAYFSPLGTSDMP